MPRVTRGRVTIGGSLRTSCAGPDDGAAAAFATSAAASAEGSKGATKGGPAKGSSDGGGEAASQDTGGGLLGALSPRRLSVLVFGSSGPGSKAKGRKSCSSPANARSASSTASARAQPGAAGKLEAFDAASGSRGSKASASSASPASAASSSASGGRSSKAWSVAKEASASVASAAASTASQSRSSQISALPASELAAGNKANDANASVGVAGSPGSGDIEAPTVPTGGGAGAGAGASGRAKGKLRKSFFPRRKTLAAPATSAANAEKCEGAGNVGASKGKKQRLVQNSKTLPLQAEKRQRAACGHCKKEFAPGDTTYQDKKTGLLSCRSCAEEMKPKCGGCGLALVGKVVDIEGRLFHPACFKCSTCTKAIDGDYRLREGAPVCPECFASSTKEVCWGCGDDIDGAFVQLDGASFHRGCLLCSSCFSNFEGAVQRGAAGELLCEACAPKCDGCGKKLSGKIVKVGDRTFHDGCFMCHTCHTPLSGRYCLDDKTGSAVCGECRTEELQRRHDKEQAKLIRRETTKNDTNRAKFGLEWCQDLVPDSIECLKRLGAETQRLPNGSGLVCVHFETIEGHVVVRCAPTANDEAAVNVSYLACALRVMHESGRECNFSLDPADPTDIGGDEQVKVFSPTWLENTVFGEVLFQADYFLKELCFGNRLPANLPELVSAWEHSSHRSSARAPSAARQWFVLRGASVALSPDGVLVPKVTMGVEARQLVQGKNGYKDAEATDPDDPAVLMTRSVTELFEKIAEREPVVRELLEVAKAQLLARFLIERHAPIDGVALAGYELPAVKVTGYTKRIPTLKKVRTSNTVDFDGAGDGAMQVTRTTHTMHGGVDLAYRGGYRVPSSKIRARLLDPALTDSTLVPLPLFLAAAAA